MKPSCRRLGTRPCDPPTTTPSISTSASKYTAVSRVDLSGGSQTWDVSWMRRMLNAPLTTPGCTTSSAPGSTDGVRKSKTPWLTATHPLSRRITPAPPVRWIMTVRTRRAAHG
jgi:hypothetical protein